MQPIGTFGRETVRRTIPMLPQCRKVTKWSELGDQKAVSTGKSTPCDELNSVGLEPREVRPRSLPSTQTLSLSMRGLSSLALLQTDLSLNVMSGICFTAQVQKQPK